MALLQLSNLCIPDLKKQQQKTANLKAAGAGGDQDTDWSALTLTNLITLLFNFWIWHMITKNAWFIYNKVMTLRTQKLQGAPQGG